MSAASYKPISAMSLPKLNPISPGDRESSVEDLRESSPHLHIVKQEPNSDGSQIDAYHTMSDSLQTVSTCCFDLVLFNTKSQFKYLIFSNVLLFIFCTDLN